MNKNIYLVFSIAAFILSVFSSLIVTTAYALDETDEQNMTGSAIKILNKYQGSWKGWQDGCINCNKPLATKGPLNQDMGKKRQKERKEKNVNKGGAEQKPQGAMDKETEKKNSKSDAEKIEGNPSKNMDVKDTSRPEDMTTKDVNEVEKDQSVPQKSNKSGAIGNDGTDSSDDTINKSEIKNEKTVDITKNSVEGKGTVTGAGKEKEKSTFSIFSIFDSK